MRKRCEFCGQIMKKERKWIGHWYQSNWGGWKCRITEKIAIRDYLSLANKEVPNFMQQMMTGSKEGLGFVVNLHFDCENDEAYICASYYHTLSIPHPVIKLD